MDLPHLGDLDKTTFAKYDSYFYRSMELWVILNQLQNCTTTSPEGMEQLQKDSKEIQSIAQVHNSKLNLIQIFDRDNLLKFCSTWKRYYGFKIISM